MTFQFKEIKKYKKLIKDKEEIKLATLIKEKENILQEINNLENQYIDTQSKIRNLYNDNFNLSLVNLYNDNLNLISVEIEENEKKIKKIDEKIEKQKITIKNATIEFKKFEKLEENHIKTQQELQKYNEKKELDEIVTNREFRKE